MAYRFRNRYLENNTTTYINYIGKSIEPIQKVILF